MGISVSDSRYTINGLIKTDNKVLDNLATLCNSCGAWLTYDIHAGLWSVIINRAGDSQHSFDDSNIVGPINISATGMDNLYNSVKVTYPHEDLNNQQDFIQITIPSGDRFIGEQDNVLQIDYPLVTNPIQAQLLGFIELKQSRVDKIVKFQTDYSKIGVKAGDLIDITNSVYGFVNKMFRVITVREVDADDGNLNIEITALEYDAEVYNESDLTRYIRTSNNGISTLGNIVTPITPTINKIEVDTRPRVEITTQVPGGLADTIEFWYTTDVPPTYTNDASRTYQLLTTAKPTTGTVFPVNTDVTVSSDNLSSGNFYIKARAKNSEATSPFSSPSGLVEYQAVQTTDNITDATKLNGSSIPGMLGAAALINVVGGLFQGNTSSGGLFSTIFGLFKDTTGTDIVNTAGQLSNIAQNSSSLNNLITKANSIATYSTLTLTASTSTVQSKFNAYAGTPGWNGNYTGGESNKVVIGFTLGETITNLMFMVQTPIGSWDYEFKDANGNIYTRNTYAYCPCIIDTYYQGTKIQQNTVDWQTQNCVIQIPNAHAGSYQFKLYPLLTYDLDQYGSENILPYNYTINSQASGGGVTITGYGFSL